MINAKDTRINPLPYLYGTVDGIPTTIYLKLSIHADTDVVVGITSSALHLQYKPQRSRGEKLTFLPQLIKY
ncbi:hypothetical protein [Nostoc sp. FACHB-280]|uniref:hypothetical protein n=1 Tax=Nostoc sp. FACHB-280 TaxID=2692839 RepID=UPI00168A94AA|nr:hypothetical protein [Nostoc sp. FACHB-280]MBD2493074.1 hypothetical protein [Nostoc sp. FACHB-280]